MTWSHGTKSTMLNCKWWIETLKTRGNNVNSVVFVRITNFIPCVKDVPRAHSENKIKWLGQRALADFKLVIEKMSHCWHSYQMQLKKCFQRKLKFMLVGAISTGKGLKRCFLIFPNSPDCLRQAMYGQTDEIINFMLIKKAYKCVKYNMIS